MSRGAPGMPRARSWRVFERRFAPMVRDNGELIWQPGEVPADSDHRYWWTVFDPMCGGNRLYLAAGFHAANRLAYVQCAIPFTGGAADQHEYVF